MNILTHSMALSLFILVLSYTSQAAIVITPTAATSTTSTDTRTIDKTIDGSGLTDVSNPASVLDDTSSYAASSYWLSASTAVSSGTEELTFDLGGTYNVDTVYYWLYTRTGTRNLKTFDISYSTDDGSSFSSAVTAASLSMSDWSIGPSDRSDSTVETRTFDQLSGVTHIRFSNLENHGDGSYFAMAELRFGGTAVPEPGVLVFCGLAGVMLLLRRRRCA